jgi:dTDP-glucose 4,6-dehydratase
MKYKKLLITGFAGFIGSHFTRKCLELGYQVVGVDSMTYASDIKHIVEFSENKNFTLIMGNINDLPDNFGCDIIINLAAESAVGKSIEDCTDFLHSNINGVHQLLEISKEKNIPLLQISTDEVLGDIVSGSFKEDANYNPSNPYSATKASAEMLIRSYARTYGVKYQIIRLTNNYGLDQDKEKLIPKAIEFFKTGKKIP